MHVVHGGMEKSIKGQLEFSKFYNRTTHLARPSISDPSALLLSSSLVPKNRFRSYTSSNLRNRRRFAHIFHHGGALISHCTAKASHGGGVAR